MTEARRAALSLGSNQGDAVAAFAYALRALEQRGVARLLAASSVWRTPPWGRTDQPDFFNIAALIDTGAAPRALLAACLRIEAERGRTRREKWGPRTLDIDIVAYGEAMVDAPDLKIPHPHATARAFVLIPLAEIAPDMSLGGRSVADWAAACDATGVAREEEASASLGRALLEGAAG